MAEKIYNVLFLCTGNSARSIMAEALLYDMGKGKFRAYSAGSRPSGRVHPFALELVKKMRLPVSDLRSKAWEEFAAPDAPAMDFVFTVCDNAAGEVCPIWPGHPATAHWGVEDPAAAEGNEDHKRQVFAAVANQLRSRIQTLVSLPVDRMDRLSLERQLDNIGKS